MKYKLQNIILTSLFVYINISQLFAHTANEKDFVEVMIMLVISLLLSLIFAAAKEKVEITKIELILFIWLIYFIARDCLNSSFNFETYSYWLFFLLLYYGLKVFFIPNKHTLFKLFFVTGLASLLFIVSYAIYHLFINKATVANIYFPNSSIFSILLAAQIAFILPLYLYNKIEYSTINIINWPLLFLIFGALVLLIFTNGRAGWLGIFAAIVYIIYPYITNSSIRKIAVYSTIPFFILMLAFLFLHKPASSNGRILVYKVSISMLKDNLLLGAGSGNFKIEYGKYQAAYFATKDIDSVEALLADNTYFSFNDIFQFVVENGVVGFAFLLLVIFNLFRKILSTRVDHNSRYLFVAAISSLICILLCSLFSYPLQVFPITFQAILCIVIINLCFSTEDVFIKLGTISSKVFKIICCSMALCLLIHFYFRLNFLLKENAALELEKAGFQEKTVENYKILYDSGNKKGTTLYQYALHLYYSNQLQSAKKVIEETKKYYTSNHVYKLSAHIENELHNYQEAERDYKFALYMVPNRMSSRNDLLNFYKERKDTTNMKYWANSIIKMRIKIPSPITDHLQIKAQKLLLEINNQ